MWRDWLSLSRREQLGFIGLVVILFIVVGVIFKKRPVAEKEIDKQLLNWVESVRLSENVIKSKKDTVFRFNPNTESVKRLQMLGFSNLAIVNLLKYREAGGVIKSPDKLKQIYGIDSMLFDKLKGYIALDIKQQKPKKKYEYASSRGSFNKVQINRVDENEEVSDRVDLQLEINTADTAMFALLKGIGPVLSRRIVAYRKKIGGYYSIQQLTEVYGLSQEVIDYNLPYLEVDETAMEPMDISTASLRQMKNHPYLDFYMAKEIYEARKAEQLISIMQFRESDCFQKADTSKLKRYFVVGKEASGEN
ncbi:helix-hairpin-helix domain-containing protein [Carboxylicivirga sp. A043]|uniref:helix-hairpin-helix domain-containing protein n=1 Tax=Carboxylicivirga litoralis TaxID=2816963 RepID=UPI0021CB051A|nr:helix-hairpin-helix domain-containing protein [Carboxylicivirga sp. A043]MCU4154449.1 helix-hairpin-helix domain-containing protein [Carboxylicivirga sp. A043]